MVTSVITKSQPVPFVPMLHINESVGVSKLFSVMVNDWEKNKTGMIGPGKFTAGSVGTATQDVVHVKVASKESA
ncbi:MAG TPA: hypothetical protein VEG63_08940 [Candidatus Acidoferrales bacterium]|nr:hypothetical protein [Candidatus Acidoferrales bacterium]